MYKCSVKEVIAKQNVTDQAARENCILSRAEWQSGMGWDSKSWKKWDHVQRFWRGRARLGGNSQVAGMPLNQIALTHAFLFWKKKIIIIISKIFFHFSCLRHLQTKIWRGDGPCYSPLPSIGIIVSMTPCLYAVHVNFDTSAEMLMRFFPEKWKECKKEKGCRKQLQRLDSKEFY